MVKEHVPSRAVHGGALRILVAAVLVCICSGSSCLPWIGGQSTWAPRVLPEQPSLAEVVRAVNANTDHIQSLATNDASIRVAGTPAMRASIVMVQPRRFRLRAGLFGSAEVDLGSNDELFWFWIRRSDPTAVFTCRHDDFAASPLSSHLALRPDWLIEALGLPRLDPLAAHQGPDPVGKGRLAIRSTLPGPHGSSTKVTVVDASTGLVVEQHWYDAAGARVASAIASAHHYDPMVGASLPGRIDVHWAARPPESPGLSMQIDLRNVQLNQVGESSERFWQPPSFPGSRQLDLCATNLGLPGPETFAEP